MTADATTVAVPSHEQQAIVDYPMRPLRVSAGAGTGKTTTLAWRLRGLVESGQASAGRILGVTFTNKAAHELAERIRSELEPLIDPGEEVTVLTYHGFAADVLDEFGLLAGVAPPLDIITPTFAGQILYDTLAAATVDALDATYPAGIVARLAKMNQLLSDHLLTPQILLAGLPDSQEAPVDIQRRELALLLEAFSKRKHDLGVVDYGDLIRMAFEVLSNHPAAAADVRERWDAVVLDEYQDTNPAQRELFRLVFGTGFPVTAVGDPVQTIYEWRGASLSNFLEFPSHFPEADGHQSATLPLTLNRRSGERIVALANRLAVRAGERSDLLARPDALPGELHVRWDRTAVDEAEHIADAAEELHRDGTAWREIAVLVRKNKDIALIRDALRDRSIPVEVANLGGLLDIPEIADVHAWLRVLADAEDSAALARILLGSRYRLGFADIAPLTEWVRRTDRQDRHHGAPVHTMLEAVEHVDDIELRPEAQNRLAKFADLYRRLLMAAQTESLVELIRRILADTDAWNEVEAMPAAHRLSARLNLYRLLDLAETWSPLEGAPSLQAFVAHLRALQEDQAEELDTARLSEEDAVAILTVHRSKGLEWDAVFLPAVYSSNFPAWPREYEDPARMPHVIPHRLRLDQDSMPILTEDMSDQGRKEVLGRRHYNQEWRTGYVAATRAREYLRVSGAFWYGHRTRPAEPSELLTVAAEAPGAVIDGWVEDPGKAPESLRYESTSDSPDPVFPDSWEAGLRTAVSDPTTIRNRATELGVEQEYGEMKARYDQLLFDVAAESAPAAEDEAEGQLAVSVTGLVTYAACPKKFFWSEIDRLPRRRSAAAARGTAVHRRIELHNRGSIPFDLEPAYDDGQGHESYERPWQAFAESRFAMERPLLVERGFELPLADATVRGRIDAVYASGEDGWEVVDFKTGRRPAGEVSTVQLEAYALAATGVELAAKRPSQVEVTYAYLGGGLDTLTHRADEAYLDKARIHLASLLEGMQDEQFDPEPGPPCHGCDFLHVCDEGQRYLTTLEPPASEPASR